MSVRVYVGNLSEDVDKQALEERLNQVEKPSALKLITDRKTGKCRGFGFATVETDEIAQKYIAELNNAEFDGQKLKVEVAQSRDKDSGDSGKGGGGPRNKRNRGNRGGSNFVDKSAAAGPDPRWADQLQRIKEQLQATQV